MEVLFISPQNQAVVEERVITISRKLDKVIDQYATKNDLEQLDDRYKIEKAHSELTDAKIFEVLEKLESRLEENTSAIRNLTFEYKILQGQSKGRKK